MTLTCSLLDEGTSGERSQCPLDFFGRDPELERVTAGTLLGGAVRLVGGFDPSSGTWDRTSVSFQVFRGLELGFAHMARGNAADVLLAVATRLPTLAREAWGDKVGELSSRAAVDSLVGQLGGATRLDPSFAWLAVGWNAIAWRGEVGAVYADEWFSAIVAPVVDWMRSSGLRQRRTFAAGVRMRNTSGTWLAKLKARVSEQGEAGGVTAALAEYGKTDRTEKIDTWEVFKGTIDTWPEPADLPWSSSPDVPRPILPSGLAGARAYSLSAIPRSLWLAGGAVLFLGVIGAVVYLVRRK